MKSEMGNVSMEVSFQKNEFQAKFINSLSQANF